MSRPDWLDDAALHPVWAALRAPLLRPARTTKLRGLSRESRHALGLLLGRPITGDVTLVLADLDAFLTERTGMSLAEVVAASTGPLPDRASDAAAREAPLAVLRAHDPAWADAVRGSRLLTRVPDAVELARTAVRVIVDLPSPPRLRTEFAATVLGDAHALDDGRPLATLVLRGLHGGALPADRRAAWEQAGLLADTVSTTVLTLGLRIPGVPHGGPVHLTPWDLRRVDPGCHHGPVLVVENPAVLEAFALRHGAEYAVVCTAGWPAAVAVELLSRLPGPLYYHGDLDWRGVEICGWLVGRCAVVPWRMTAADYLAASGSAALAGREVATPWEPELAAAMRRRGVAVYEEQLLDTLLDFWRGTTDGSAEPRAAAGRSATRDVASAR